MLQAKSKFVMPVKTGIQVRFWLKFKTRLDSGVRRKDKKQSTFSRPRQNPRLIAQGR
jgi:hypothetical protein